MIRGSSEGFPPALVPFSTPSRGIAILIPPGGPLRFQIGETFWGVSVLIKSYYPRSAIATGVHRLRRSRDQRRKSMLGSIAGISMRQAGNSIASHRISRSAAAAIGGLRDRSHCERWLQSGFDICGVTSSADLSPPAWSIEDIGAAFVVKLIAVCLL
jgi:hypothetical protein